MASLQNNLKYSESEYKNLLEKFLQKNSLYNAAICYNDLGNIYLHKKFFKKAVSFYNSALKLNKINYIVLNNLGTVYREKNNFQKAIFYYKKSLEEKNNYALALLNLEFALMNTCDWRNIKASNFKTPFMSVITEDDPSKNFQTSKRFTKQS